MGNKRLNTTNHFGWTQSPLRNSHVNNSVYKKHQDYQEKYLESGNFVLGSMPEYPIEPESYEEGSCPDDNKFRRKYNIRSIFISYKLPCRNEEICIQRKKG